MSPVTHQTVRLSRGSHASPEQGVCVMELASMLAGERFTDHPSSVCPVIASFLRTFNDLVGDERRQGLYACASAVVGSRASKKVQRARAKRLHSVSVELHRRRRPLARLVPMMLRIRFRPPIKVVGLQAARVIALAEQEFQPNILAVVDELVALGAHERPLPTIATAATALGCPAQRPTGCSVSGSSTSLR